MKTLLICHDDAPLHYDGLARWLASWSSLAGIVRLHEDGTRRWKRIRRETKRVGAVRMADVFAFRLYYRFRLAGRDAVWSKQALADLQRRFPPVPANTAVLDTESPNTDEAAAFIREHQPDIMLALCKQIIKASVFTIPTSGTFVLHPGICPEYRNAHGCFWALANDDPQRVGMTLLRIDRGIDTGPVFGYFSYPFDELRESHIVIQHRVVLDNLDAIAARLTEVHQGTATPIPTGGRRSGEWGQPWLTSYLRRRRRASRSVDAYSRA